MLSLLLAYAASSLPPNQRPHNRLGAITGPVRIPLKAGNFETFGVDDQRCRQADHYAAVALVPQKGADATRILI